MVNSRPMAVVTQPGKIEIQTRPLPALGPREVLVEVKAVTLCGSDLHIFKGMHPAAPLPVPVGHEIAGKVVEVGAQVTLLQPGTPVVVEPVLVCGTCQFCRRGQYHLCREISFQYRRGQGGLTSHFVVSEQWVHPLPPGISYAQGAILEPLAVVVHAAQKAALKPGDSCLILGAGAIGLLLLQVVKALGAGDTFIADVQPGRLNKAQQLGADFVLDNLRVDLLQEILAHTDGLGVERAFEAAGLESTLVQMLAALKKGGVGVLVGLYEKLQVSIPANILVQKELSLHGSQGYCWDFQTAIQLVRHGRIDLQSLISHAFPFESVQEAFEVLMDPREHAVKVVISFGNQ